MGVVIWERELDVDGGHDKITRGFSLLGSKKYCRDDSAVYDERRVGVSLGGFFTRDRRDLANQRIYTAEAVHHCSAGGMPAHI